VALPVLMAAFELFIFKQFLLIQLIQKIQRHQRQRADGSPGRIGTN